MRVTIVIGVDKEELEAIKAQAEYGGNTIQDWIFGAIQEDLPSVELLDFSVEE